MSIYCESTLHVLRTCSLALVLSGGEMKTGFYSTTANVNKIYYLNCFLSQDTVQIR